MSYIEQYYEEIQSGRIAASRRLLAVYKKLVDDIKNPKGEYVFDEARGNRPIEFIETFCCHSKGEWAGRKVRLELFQKAYLCALFGFVHKDTGLRKFRESFFYVARKAGKTTLMAGLSLYMLVADGESGSEVYSLGTKRDQAKLLFDEAHAMVRQSPELKRIVEKKRDGLYCGLTFSKMQALAKNSNSLDGLNCHFCVMDEMHAWTDRNLYDVMKTSQSARRQPLTVIITTAGTTRQSVFDDMYSYACSVADGTFTDETYLPIIYELDSKTEWQNPRMWEKANPGLSCGIKKLEDIVQKVERARQSPVDLQGFLCKDMNVISTVAKAWLSWSDIENTATWDVKDFKGYYAVGSADLSITTDLTSAAILVLGKDGTRYVKSMSWLPKATFEQRVQEEKIPYDKWLEQGLVRLCEGNSINYSDVTQWFLEVVNEWEITPAWIYYDPYSARYWVDEMESYGFNMVKCYQGSKTLSNPMYQLGADLKEKKVNYDNSPIMKWACANVGVTEDRNGNIVPIKAQAAKQRIDPFMSMLDAYVGLCDHLAELEMNAL